MPSPVAPVISATLPSRLTSEHRRNQRRTATVPPPAALRCYRAVGHALVQDLVSIGKLRVCARLERAGLRPSWRMYVSGGEKHQNCRNELVVWRGGPLEHQKCRTNSAPNACGGNC